MFFEVSFTFSSITELIFDVVVVGFPEVGCLPAEVSLSTEGTCPSHEVWAIDPIVEGEVVLIDEDVEDSIYEVGYVLHVEDKYLILHRVLVHSLLHESPFHFGLIHRLLFLIE